jgi:head-tail adaptor
MAYGKGIVLNRKLMLEAPVRTPDGAGGFVETWAALGTLWARIEARAGDENAGQFGSESVVNYKIFVRAAPVGSPARPKPEQRLSEDGRIFRIQAVTEWDQAGLYLVCFAREEVLS